MTNSFKKYVMSQVFESTAYKLSNQADENKVAKAFFTLRNDVLSKAAEHGTSELFHPTEINNVISLCYHESLEFVLTNNCPQIELIIEDQIKVCNNPSEDLSVYIRGVSKVWSHAFDTEMIEGKMDDRLDRLIYALLVG